MCRHIVVLLLLIGTGILARPAGGAEPADKADIARLIEQLGSVHFPEREAATQALDAVGPAALEALRGAAASPDGEVARRARELVERLERRLRTARALEGPRFHLVYRDTPVPDAVADFVRKTGYPLQIDEREKAHLAQRKITLDTGDVPFWEALDQLCDRAGLTEKQPAPGQTPSPEDPYGNILGKARFRRELYPSMAVEGRSNGMTLTEGKRPVLPTSLAGALRLQVQPARGPVQGISRQDGEALLALEVAPAPGLEWLGLISLRVNRALDDRGQALIQPGAYLGPETPFVGDPEEVMIFLDGFESVRVPQSQRPQLPVRLKLPNPPARTVRELQGTLAGVVLTRPLPLITVEDVFQAAGRTVKGSDGGSIKVIETKEDNGRVTLKVQVEAPPDDTGFLGGAAWAELNQRRIALQALRGGNNPDLAGSTLAQQLALLDARGQAIPPQDLQVLPGGNISAPQVQLTYHLRAGQDKPSRLVYTDRRRVVIEVPFTLQDVPLP